MAVSILSGLRSKVVLPRGDEGPGWQSNPREPSRSVAVSTRLVLLEVRFRPSIQQGYDFEVELEFEERPTGDSETGLPNSGNPTITLSFPVSGKEVALLTGLANRNFRLSGRVPEERDSYDQIRSAFADLAYQYEDLVFQLSEAQSNSRDTTQQALAYRDSLQAS